MNRIIDYIYVIFFGKYTLDGFASEKKENQKCRYVFESVFPNEEIMKIALPSSSSITSK